MHDRYKFTTSGREPRHTLLHPLPRYARTSQAPVDLAPTTGGCAWRSSSGRTNALVWCSSSERLKAACMVHLAPTSSSPCAVRRPPPRSMPVLHLHPASTSWLSMSGVYRRQRRALICSPRNPTTSPSPRPLGWRIGRLSDQHELGKMPLAPRSSPAMVRSTLWLHTRPHSGWRVPCQQAKVASPPPPAPHTTEAELQHSESPAGVWRCPEQHP
jgi:hypothetical protein